MVADPSVRLSTPSSADPHAPRRPGADLLPLTASGAAPRLDRPVTVVRARRRGRARLARARLGPTTSMPHRRMTIMPSHPRDASLRAPADELPAPRRATAGTGALQAAAVLLVG